METERQSPRYAKIDVWDAAEILEAMIEGQFTAVAAVRAARPAIEKAALATERRLRGRGRLVYVGAGTSGRLAVQDGAELMPTFGWPQERLVLLMAGGHNALLQAVEGAEDQDAQAIELVVSDIEMPRLDGYALTRAIREAPTLRRIKVLLHSSLSGMFNEGMVKEVKADRFVAKFHPDQLAQAVMELLPEPVAAPQAATG